MRAFVGIDLGSTTSKAVMLGEDGEVIGRGITNSRSNYGVATAAARAEALIDARLHLVREALSHTSPEGADIESVLEELNRHFRKTLYLRQLDALAATCLDHDAATGHSLQGQLEHIFEGLREQANELFAPGSKRQSDFFRDLAGSGFYARAEQAACDTTATYDEMAGSYDRAIQIVENQVPELSLQRDLGDALQAAANGKLPPGASGAVEQALRTPITEERAVGTGYGRAQLPFPKEQIRSEILCHGLGAHAMYADTATVLDIGGQDTKAIQVDGQGVVESFQMNDRCAAGCGRYLGYIADELGLGLHQLGPLALEAQTQVRITSTCTVFAGAELRDRLALGQRREDILGGLHRAIMLRAMSLLARSGGVRDQLTFTGGVANNVAAVRALRQLVEENYEGVQINIDPHSIYMGALGAALFARRGGEAA